MRINSIGVMPPLNNRRKQSNKNIAFGKFYSELEPKKLPKAFQDAVLKN